MVARKFLASLATVAVGVLSLAAPAQAQVFQTDAAKTSLPQPVGADELNLITGSWGHAAATESWKDPVTGAQLTAALKYGDYYSPPDFPQFVDGDAITLQGLFKWRGEKLDPVKDAKTAPGYFSPACGFSGQRQNGPLHADALKALRRTCRLTPGFPEVFPCPAVR